MTAVTMIDHLEINGEILYGRVENIERSTLIA